MLTVFVQWLDSVGPFVFWTCAVLLVAIDGIAVAAVVSTRSRELVNRWTGPVLVANALLLGTGVGVPVAMRMTSAAVSMLVPSTPTALTGERALDGP
jgi:hypothetical protein